MKIMCKTIMIVALCAGFLQITEAANLKVKMFKLDPASRKQTWSYKIITKSTKTKPQLKKFKEDTTLSINPKDFESILTVYTNSTGAEGGSKPRDLPLAKPVIEMLQDKSTPNAITVDKDGSLNIIPLYEVEKLIKSDAKNTREISVQKVGSNRDEWRITSWGEADWAVDGVTIEQGKTKAKRRLAVPKTGWIVFLISNKTNPRIEYSALRLEKEQAEKLKVLKLNDDGLPIFI